MKKIIYPAIFLFILVLSLSLNTLQAQQLNYPSDRLLVKFSAQAKAGFDLQFKQELKLNKSKQFKRQQTELWQLDFPITIKNTNYATLDDILPYLNMLPEIEYAEPDYYVELLTTPNDPMFNLLWGQHNTGQSSGLSDADIDAVEAWDIQSTSPDVIVSILDTGIDWTHPDLVENIWQNLGEDLDNDGVVVEWNGTSWVFDPDDENGIDDDGNGYIDDFVGWDFKNNDNDPMDGHSHGTHCAGTIGASGNNNIGVAGVSWDVQLMGLKIFGDNGDFSSISAVVAALEYAVAADAPITSNSWGGGGFSITLHNAIQNAHTAEQLFVAAAGNDYGNDNDLSEYYPASYDLDNIVAVAATDHVDGLADFSNYGATMVDLGAPGENIYSTVPNGAYGYKSGTSMATPQVSGALALLWGKTPSLGHLDLKNQVLATTDPVSSLAGKCLSGGRLNVNNALLESAEEPPIAVFTYPRTGLTADFTLTYPIANTIYTWDFGDGNTATGENPSHAYSSEGIYEARLIATNNFGTDTSRMYLSVTANTSCLYADSLELVAFYTATGGPNWTNTWDLNAPVDTWYGVTVSGCGVTCLDLDGSASCSYWNLGGNNLIGMIMDLNLPDLEGLHLVRNKLTGNIPDFSSLSILTHLSLFENQLTGNIPDFANLNNLIQLKLDRNQLTGSIPNFTTMNNLTNLSLSQNQLTGNIPDFANLTNLTGLSLGRNRLTGNIPDFANLNNLTWLGLNYNQLTGNVPDFANLNNLTNLYLEENELSGNIPNFPNLNNLNWLYLDNNQLTGSIPDFANLNNLTNFTLHENQLTGNVPNFSNLNNLKILVLFDNQLTGSIPNFSSLNNLTTLYLNSNQLSGKIPNFTNLNNLTGLILNNNQLTGSIPNFANLNTNLQHLKLNNNQLTGNVPDFSNFSNLEYLYLDNNSLNFDGIAENLFVRVYPYAPQDSIQTNVIGNTLSVYAGGDLLDNTYIWYKDGIPQDTIIADSTFSPIQSGYYNCRVENDTVTIPQGSKELYLWSKTVYYSPFTNCLQSDSLALVELYNATNGPNWTNTWDLNAPVSTWIGVTLSGDGCEVTRLNLSGNNLSGNLLDFNLPNIDYLNLSLNQLTDSLVNFQNLFNATYINLSFNQLTGEIPHFDNLNKVSLLAVNNNQLNGTMPDLSDLNNLSYLAIFGNQLNFDGIASNLFVNDYRYDSQDSILTNLNTNTLSVYAGGNLSDNTYIWYKDGIPQDTIIADSTFISIQAGYYNCRVENAVVTIPQGRKELYLWSKTVYFEGLSCNTTAAYTGPDQSCASSSLTFTNTSTSAVSYEWQVDGSTVATTNDFTQNFPEAGDYTITLIASDGGTCADTYSEVVSIKASATAFNPVPQVVFCEETGVLDAGIAGMGTYIWIHQGIPKGSSQSITVTEEGIYTIGVQDYCGGTALDSIAVSFGDCVWPGDFNNDGVVNIFDLFSSGLAYGNTGPTRTNASLTWEGQYCDDWPSSDSGINDKYSDGNGDGVIESSDNIAITENFGKTHPVTNTAAILTWNKNIRLRPRINKSLSTDSTRFVEMKLELRGGGDVELYSIGFRYLYQGGNGAVAHFDNSLLGAEGSEVLGISKDVNGQYIDMAITRITGSNEWVDGPIINTVVTLHDLPVGQVRSKIVNPTMMLNTGEEQRISSYLMNAFYPGDDSTYVILGNNNPASPVEFYINALPYTCDEAAEAEVFVMEGAAPYSYQWSNGETTAHITGIAAGTHRVTVTDAQGEYREGYIYVGEAEAFQVALQTTAASNNQANGTATANIIGDSSNISYLWDDGQTTATAIGLAEGMHSITVSNSTGCIDILDFEILGDRVQVQVKAFLQGNYDSNTKKMKDDLRQYGFIPALSPYGTAAEITPDLFDTTGDNAIIDWIQVELRDKNDPTLVIATQDAFLQSDGDVVDLDGVSALTFPNITAEFYYVVLRHRNHLAVMSLNPVLLTKSMGDTVDFTQGVAYGTNPIYTFSDGTSALIAGDTDGNGTVDAADRSNAWNDRNQTGYNGTDCHLKGIVDAEDRSRTWNNRNLTSQVP